MPCFEMDYIYKILHMFWLYCIIFENGAYSLVFYTLLSHTDTINDVRFVPDYLIPLHLVDLKVLTAFSTVYFRINRTQFHCLRL